MRVACGVDVIKLSRNDAPWRATLPPERIYHAHELATSTEQQRAGSFALKEAAIKALGLAPGSWLDLSVERQSSGKPALSYTGSLPRPASLDCSLSHDGDYLVAFVVALFD